MVTDSFIIFCNHQIVQRLDICGNSLSHTLQNFILDLIKKIIHDIIKIDNLPCKLQILLNVCIDAFCYHRSCCFRHILQTDACIRHTKTRYFYDIRNIRCLVSDPLHIGNHF